MSAVMALAVGAFLVFNTMNMAALERRRELATMRAIGGRRRSLLRASGGALILGAGLSALAACAPAAPTNPSAPTGVPAPATSVTQSAALPTYVPFSGPKPDFPPSADGVVPAGYLTFPSNLVKSSTGPIGKAGD